MNRRDQTHDPAGTGPSAGTGTATEPGALTARDTWRALYARFRPHRRTVAFGALLTLIGSLSGLAQPLAAKELVHRLGGDEPVTDVLLLLTALVVLGTAVSAAGGYVLERTAESVVLAARRSLVGRMLRLRVPDMDRTQPGDLMSRITSDTTLLRAVTTQSVVSGTTGALTFAGAVVLMGFQDPVLLGVTLGVIVLIATATALVMPRIARATGRAQEAVATMSALLERAFGAIRTVKASGAEARETAALEEAAQEAWRQGVTSAKWQSVAGTSVGLAVQVSFLAVLGIGGARVASGAISVATLVAFLLLLFYLIEPVAQLVEAATQYQVGAAAVARIVEAERMGTEDTGPSPDRTGTPPDPEGPASVTFESVTFRYDDDLPYIHHGVDFAVPGGGMTAFVGPSGAGKTTVFGLIERFYETTGGRVLVDGVDVRDWSLDRLRASIGYVEQDAPVLSGTLRENLLFAAPHATDREVADVLRQARLEGLVERLPDGLDTRVGHRGTKLSGGERQRVAIARALLRKPRLLLLDEATSQLDAVNELALRDTVADAARHTTVLVVAHRLSTVTLADRIVVMEAGRVRAVGTHAELTASDALYEELATTQFLVPGADARPEAVT